MATTLLLCLLSVASADLFLNEEGSFKIVQFTDMLFGVDDEADEATQDAMRAILEKEEPDLAVITGNVVFGSSWDGSQTDWFAD